MLSFNYINFVSRNYFYIQQQIQEKIQNTKLCFFGTGLSSTIAEQCARLGFVNFNLVDGDKIEISNLNRQVFSLQDVGKYKVETLRNKILSINPECNISTENIFLESLDQIKDKINSSDIIINTIDCSALYFEIIEYARLQNKLVICPFNPGFGGLVMCFSKDSASPYKVFDFSKQINDFEIVKQLFMLFPQIKTLEHLNITLEDASLLSNIEYFPQTTIGASITCGMVLTALVSYLKNEKIIQMPNIYYFDSLYYNLG